MIIAQKHIFFLDWHDNKIKLDIEKQKLQIYMMNQDSIEKTWHTFEGS